MYNFSAKYKLRVTLFSVQCCYLHIYKLIGQPRGVYFFVDSTNISLLNVSRVHEIQTH